MDSEIIGAPEFTKSYRRKLGKLLQHEEYKFVDLCGWNRMTLYTQPSAELNSQKIHYVQNRKHQEEGCTL